MAKRDEPNTRGLAEQESSDRLALRHLLEQIVRTFRIIRRVAAGPVTRAQPGWTPAEHALHLVLVAEAVARNFDAAPISATPESGPLSKRLAKAAVLLTMRIPRGAAAPAEVVPTVVMMPSDLERRAQAAKEALIRLARSGATVHARVEHPYLGPMSFREWMRFSLIHALHHERLIRACV